MNDNAWNLVADIGGTNARFSLAEADSNQLTFTQRYAVADYREFNDALLQFLHDIKTTASLTSQPQAACFAVACPAENDTVKFTNSPWTINGAEVSRLLDGAKVSIINDFAAVGYGSIDLDENDWHQIGGENTLSRRPIGILGPGTGLGVCSVVPTDNQYYVINGEGGHVDFAPTNDQEIAVFDVLRQRFGRVSVERLLSGAGILNIYQALASISSIKPIHDSPADVSKAALNGDCSISIKALAMFCEVLGSVAGDLCLTLGAKGGIYIAGGIVPRMIPFLENSNFRQRFEAKGRFQDYLSNIPVRAITKDDIGLHGALHVVKHSIREEGKT